MTVDDLIARLDKVKPAGHGRWIACCPAHEDRSPSLSIKELPDGKILIHDFAGCGAADVLTAIGLEFRDLYPDSMPGQYRISPVQPKHLHAAREALRIIRPEALLVCVAAESIASGISLDNADRDRLLLAVERIRTAQGAVG